MSKLRVDQLETLDSLNTIDVGNILTDADLPDIVNTLPTISGLQSFDSSNLSDNSIVFVSSRQSDNDGGAGIFYLDASDTTSSDNSVTVIVDASSSRWKRVRQPGYYQSGWFISVNEAITIIASEEATVKITNDLPLTASVTSPSNISYEFSRGGSFSGAFTLTIDGVIRAGRYKIIDDATSIVFSVQENSNDEVWAEWFGADPTGTDPSASAFNRAKSACKEGATLRFGQGTFLIDTTIVLDKPIKFMGASRRQTALQWNGGAGTMIITSGSKGHVELYDFNFYNTGTGTNGIEIRSVNSIVQRVRCGVSSEVSWTGVAIGTEAGSTVYDVVLRDCELRSPVSPHTPFGVNFSQGHTLTIENCMIVNFGTLVKVGDESSAFSVTGFSMTNSRLETNTNTDSSVIGLLLELANNPNVSGCNFTFGETLDDPGFATQLPMRIQLCRGGLITGNWFSGDGEVNNAISVTSTARNVKIDGNTFWRFTGTPFAISGTPILDVGQNLTPSPTDPGATIDNNSATPYVGNGGLFFLSNTSATTVTNFTGGGNFSNGEGIGKTVRFVFKNSNTTIDFSSNSNLKGNGGVDFTGNQDDAMICVHDGARWYCSIIEA